MLIVNASSFFMKDAFKFLQEPRNPNFFNRGYKYETGNRAETSWNYAYGTYYDDANWFKGFPSVLAGLKFAARGFVATNLNVVFGIASFIQKTIQALMNITNPKEAGSLFLQGLSNLGGSLFTAAVTLPKAIIKTTTRLLFGNFVDAVKNGYQAVVSMCGKKEDANPSDNFDQGQPYVSAYANCADMGITSLQSNNFGRNATSVRNSTVTVGDSITPFVDAEESLYTAKF